MGLVFHFFTLMFLGIVWGAIHAWKPKVSYALFIGIAILGFASHLFLATQGGDTSVDLVQTLVGVAGFGFGHAGGKAGFKQAFADNRRRY